MEVYSKISFRNIITKEIEDVNEFTQFTFEFKIKDIKKIPPNQVIQFINREKVNSQF